MSEHEFYPKNIAYIDCAAGVQRVQEELKERPQGIRQLVRESSTTVGGQALISRTESQLLSEIINPRDRSTGAPIHKEPAAYRATAGGVLLGWEICRKDLRKYKLAPYGRLENAMKQHVHPGKDEAEVVALTAERLVDTSGMGLALLSEQSSIVEDWLDAIEPDVRLQTLTKIGLGLMVHQANKAVGAADLAEMKREAQGTDWESLAQEIDAWRQSGQANS